MPDNPNLLSDVTVRAWEPHMGCEGARFKAVVVRQDVTVQVMNDGVVRPGIVVIAPSAHPGENAADVVVQAARTASVRLSILRTDELLWQPITAQRDELANWRIECIPFIEFFRLCLGDKEPVVARSQDGR